MGNILANISGHASFNFEVDNLKIMRDLNQLPAEDLFNIVGRSVMIHLNDDDLGMGTGHLKEESQKTGNVG